MKNDNGVSIFHFFLFQIGICKMKSSNEGQGLKPRTDSKEVILHCNSLREQVKGILYKVHGRQGARHLCSL